MNKNKDTKQKNNKGTTGKDDTNTVDEDIHQLDENTTEAMSQELTEYEDAMLQEKEKRMRLMADFENYKKRMEAEKATFGAIANLGLIREVLEVSDDIVLALDDENLSLETAKQSLETAKEKIAALVRNAGVEKIEVNKGDTFDKEIMEAIQAVPDSKNAGKVIAVISSAYKYTAKEGIIKPAKVIVGK